MTNLDTGTRDDAYYEVHNTWNGGKGGRQIVFCSSVKGTAGHNECFVWIQKNTPYSFHEATTHQGYEVRPVYKER